MAAGKQQRNASSKKRKPQWVEHMDWVYSQPLDSPSQTLVLTYLVRRADKNGICWPKIKTISSDTKICDRTVKEAIKQIAACGLISITRIKIPSKREGRSGIKNRYKLNFLHTTTLEAVKASKTATTKRPHGPVGQPRPKGNSCTLVSDDQSANIDTTKVQQLPRKVVTIEKTPVDASLDGLKEKSKDQKPLSKEKKSSGTTDGYPTLAGDFDIGVRNSTQPVKRPRPGIFRPAPIPPGPWTPPRRLADEPGAAT